MAKKKMLKSELERRDKLGENIIVLCQKQIDALICIICNVAEHYSRNENMSKQEFNAISLDKISQVQMITEMKQGLLNDYEKDSER